MDNKKRIGVFGDLHLGHSGIGAWHNRLMFDQAEEVVRKTVALLNELSLDMVIILGDVTNNGEAPPLKLAEAVLSTLTAPWLIIPGNHDRELVRTGLFTGVFGEHVPHLYSEAAGIPSLFLTEYLPSVGHARTELGSTMIDEAVEKIRNRNLDRLFIFSHFPLISQSDYADQHAANYAKHYLDGEELLDRLGHLVSGRIHCFSAHQHWHRVIEGNKIVHCMTASMIEYPMEARVVSVEKDRVSVRTIETACPEIAAMSLDSATWVSGQESDRHLAL